MRIILQQKDSGLYFKSPNVWVHNSLEAVDFVNSTAAIEFCAQERLAGVQLVLKFERERYEIVLPCQLGGASATARPRLSA
ncbi:MAG: hypothetical protein ACLQM8_22140 [Limisphaerales bacterium]